MTDDAALAARADHAGVDRIGIDLDRLGKAVRQPAGYRISAHAAEDLKRLEPVVRRGLLFARTDPIHAGSRGQIEELLSYGARSLMLPMFRRVEEAASFVDMVAGRAEVVLLVETVAAAFRLDDIAGLPGVDEIVIGLNDMHLEAHLENRFEIVASDLMETMATSVTRHGVRFGLGGLGRADDESLPVPSSLVYPQYARLGATSALLARSFFEDVPGDLGPAIREARRSLADFARAPREELEEARARLRRHLHDAACHPATEFPILRRFAA